MRNVVFTHLVSLQSGAQPLPSGQALDPWELVMHASFVVSLVLIALVVMSLACWFIIGAKLVRLGQAKRESAAFLERFWGAELGPAWDTRRLEGLYASLGGVKNSPLARVFHAGYVELARVLERTTSAPARGESVDNIERALRRAAAGETTRLESMVPFLATTGSVAPFVGLFGTVWGIMNSFISIGAQKNASLDVVAPGIAEALIATAIGLAAAIPAVMAYNYFVRRIQVLQGEMEAFAGDYLNIVRRYFLV